MKSGKFGNVKTQIDKKEKKKKKTQEIGCDVTTCRTRFEWRRPNLSWKMKMKMKTQSNFHYSNRIQGICKRTVIELNE